MPTLLSLSWRLLLVAALVFNPVAGAAAMLAADAAKATAQVETKVSAEMPPCHGMAPESATAAPEVPSKPHGDCDNAACQFAACCAIGALDLSTTLRAPQIKHAGQALPSLDFRQADAPPPARMIRPPIA
jgi:hypothetical protein